MTQVNGYHKDPINQDSPRASPGKIISTSMMRPTINSYSEPSPSPEPAPWSSAVGHASTGKSGRVIERLQGDIDRLHREKQLLKMRNEEVEKANENLVTTNQFLQDRNSNYEQSHEANQRQINRKERQVEDLKEELRRERARTARAEEQARVASANEEEWREQANQSRAVATQREAEYDAMVTCRNLDNDRHQSGIDNIRSSFQTLLRQREEDHTRQRKLEIVAEQQRQTISQLEDLTKKLTFNFKAYRMDIDTTLGTLRTEATYNDNAMKQKIHEMSEVSDKMRWVMKVDEVVNHNTPRQMPPTPTPKVTSVPRQPTQEQRAEPSPSKSPTKNILGFETRSKHRRKESSKGTK